MFFSIIFTIAGRSRGDVLYIPKPNEERPTISTALQELNDALESKYHSQYHSKHRQDEIDDPHPESRVRYTPKITAWNGDIATEKATLERTTKNILTCEGSLKKERLKQNKNMHSKIAHILKLQNIEKKFGRKNQRNRNKNKKTSKSTLW